jgi:16S rRNA (guanine527-N7)-methyltransferase
MMTGPEAFCAARSVSRETLDRLRLFDTLLRRWTARVNLIAAATVDQVWTRHILDSAQLFDLSPANGHWVDLGSGGGFPGLVIAIIAAAERPSLATTLVESDLRKGAFLATVARETGLRTSILTERIESLPDLQADVLSARALAPLPRLLDLSARHMKPGATALFPKGARHDAEIRDALANWRFSYKKHPSLTDPSATILALTGVSRV